MFEQEVLDFMRGREPAPIGGRCDAFGEVEPGQAAPRLMVARRFGDGQPTQIAPCRHQRGACRGECLAEGLLGWKHQLHNRKMATGALHFKG
jgi:hypothetical protein